MDEELTIPEIAQKLKDKFGDLAMDVVNIYLADLKMSFNIAKELHPHAEGLVAGGLMQWTQVKNELEGKTS
tara:strand:+ start:224341 stop:224553 length:213 start_codon:yes stop_codon:yes gene_type:complete